MMKSKVTLVLGAGVSVGLVADWDGLTRQLARDAKGSKLVEERARLDASFPNANQIELELAFRALVERSLAARERAGVKGRRAIGDRMLALEREAELAWIAMLRGALYAPPRAASAPPPPYLAGRGAGPRAHARRAACPNATLRAIGDALRDGRSPVRRVITFNADDWLEYELWRGAPRAFHTRFRIVTQPTFGPDARAYEASRSSRDPGERVAIVHAHGFLCHPMEPTHPTYSSSRARVGARGAHAKGRPPRSPRAPSYDAPNMLVFRDLDYWRTVANPSSFANVTLLDALMNSRCVFVGLSFRDINLLRWLGVMAAEHEDTWQRRWNLHFRDGGESVATGRSWMRWRNGHVALLGADAAPLGAYLAHRGITARAVRRWDAIGDDLRRAIDGS